MLVTDATNVTYLTGFTGDDSFLLVGDGVEVIVSDGRYTEQLAEQCPALDVAVRPPATSIVPTVARVVQQAGLSRVGVESRSMTLALHEQVSDQLPDVQLVPTAGLVEQLREIKDREEIAEIRQAVGWAERAFAVIRAALQPEQTEREIAFALENQMRRFGAAGCAFPPIVASGPRAALPHAVPTGRQIGQDSLLLVDWGATAHLYRSDLTRVLVTGRISPKLQRIYEVVLQAQQQAIAAIRPGVPVSEVDQAARSVIASAGYGKHFNHGLGHGFGLQIHEGPSLASRSDRPLKAGMVVTVEPGIYLPNWGGVRIEDDVLVTRSGHEVLSNAPRELTDCVVW
jgi:Xaa-Pro aminopeptidase